MKRFILTTFISTAFILIVSGCALEDSPQSEAVSSSVKAEIEAKIDPVAEATESLVTALPEQSGYSVDLETLDKFISLVTPFNIAPSPFFDSSELSDETMVFASAILKNALFEDMDDGISASLSFADLEDGVSAIFGPEAKLSDEFETKEYSPYILDVENEVIIRQYATSGMAGYFFPYAVDGYQDVYKLYLIDLTDPLFFNDMENQELLMTGGEVTFDMIEDIYTEMQCNVYTIKPNGTGYYIAEFEYINFKEKQLY